MDIKDIIDKLLGRNKGPAVTVPELLSGLQEGYEFFSSILYDKNEIDHVVFSRKQGLFLINSAHEKGTVSYNGTHMLINRKTRSDIIKNGLKDAFWLKSIIREQIGVDVFITPVVVFEKAKVKVTQPIIGVVVVETSGLVDTILNAPERNVLEDGVLMVLRELHGIQTIKYRSM